MGLLELNRYPLNSYSEPAIQTRHPGRCRKVRRLCIHGAAPRNSVGGRGMASTEGHGHPATATRRTGAASLLKILLTNFCQYDCLYCVNRVTSNIAPGALHSR